MKLTPTQVPSDLDALIAEMHAARFLGVSARSLQKWRCEGGGPNFVRVSSRCIRYRRRDLIEWSESRLKSSTAA
jgi:hypothetical protein